MKMTLGELRQLIALLVEAHVSSLPPKEKVINPNAKKVAIVDPRDVELSSRRPARPSSPASKVSSELTDDEIQDKLDLYGVDRDNVLDMLASDRNLRRDLGLGSDAKRNSDYYRRVYSAAAKKR